MSKYKILSGIFLLTLLCVTHGGSTIGKHLGKPKRYKSTEFDILIFTQRWPITACFIWKEDSASHVCVLPKHNEWTIHGLWPTKNHTIGPGFCNKSLPFDPQALAPLESQLKEYWIDVHKEAPPYSFWKHEWIKHGTCGVTIEALNSEVKYFQTGLSFLGTYNMMDVLAKANIMPGQKYMVGDMLKAIKKELNKTGQVTCTKDQKTGEWYLNEIRICFNKMLQLTDCDNITDFPTNCDKLKPITYPSHVPYNYYAVQT